MTVYKICTNCEVLKGDQEFYPDKKDRRLGLSSWCKACMNSKAQLPKVKAKTLARFNKRAANPAEHRKMCARYKLRRAVRIGRIIKPTLCSQCDNPGKIQGHHNDYSKPYEVIWVCTSCHKDFHRELSRGSR